MGMVKNVDLRRNSWRMPGLPAVGSFGASCDFRPSGVPTYVGTSDVGKLKNTSTCTHSTMWGKNMMDTNIFTSDWISFNQHKAIVTHENYKIDFGSVTQCFLNSFLLTRSNKMCVQGVKPHYENQ